MDTLKRLTYQIGSLIDSSTINILYINVLRKKIGMWFDKLISDQYRAFHHQSMIITSVVNSFNPYLDDEKDNFCQDANENVGSSFKETWKINSC